MNRAELLRRLGVAAEALPTEWLSLVTKWAEQAAAQVRLSAPLQPATLRPGSPSHCPAGRRPMSLVAAGHWWGR